MFGLFKKHENSGAQITNSAEYERLSKKITDISSDLAALKGQLEIHKTDLANLRGKFNQRLRGREDQSTDQPAKPEEFINSNEVPIG